MTALGKKNLFNLGKRAYYIQIMLTAVATAYLSSLFFRHDFSIQYVYSYSSSDLSFFYLLSALWAGQEGTYLLWLLFSSLFGLLILKKGEQYKVWGMFFYSLINLFLLIMMLTLSPFKPLDFLAIDGSGLNELLQDPWMVIHPPITFVAFAMAGVPFAIVLAAMVRKDFSRWLQIAMPYVLVTVLSFALANVLGGLWAYKTLGWGGYWAWDPVENTSFIPWMVALALVHSMLIEKRTGALRRSNLLMTASVFLLTIYGTFLTRSGVLADFSVHSFVDLGINAVLISFVLIYFLLTLGIFFYSSRAAIGKPMNYNIFTRDFVLFIGMLLLFVLGVIVLFWSSLPLITKYLSENPAAAEISTYNSFAFPFVILISLFLTLAPFIKGRGGAGEGEVENIKSQALIYALPALILALALYFLNTVIFATAVTIFIYFTVITIYFVSGKVKRRLIQSLLFGLGGVVVALLLDVKEIDKLLFIGAALTAAGANLLVLLPLISRDIKRTGAQLNHFGFGLLVIGILASSAFSENEKVLLPRNEAAEALGYSLTYRGISGDIEDKNNEVLITVEDTQGNSIDAKPKYFYSRRMDGMMKNPYIQRNLTFDLYLSPQEIQESPKMVGLMISKGETEELGPFLIKFINFEMGSHGQGGSMTVGAQLEVEFEGRTETIVPQLYTDPQGGPGMVSDFIPLVKGSGYEIKLLKVFADQGAASFLIPGLVDAGGGDRLILDVTRKPGINLLWLGTILIFVGTGFSIGKRVKKQK